MNEIINISIDKLIPFENHPFKTYEGTRFEEMVLSIKESGILNPLLVRPKDNGYEILAGHNRKNAAEEAGLTEVPCIIKKNLSDNEANLIVVVTNLNQRSFADMKHSERAKMIKIYHDTLKSLKGQGYRSDIFDNADKDITSSQSGKKLSMEQTGDFFKMSKNNISRYENITKLTPDFLDLLDNAKIGFTTAVDISALSVSEQEILYKYITEKHVKINTSQSEELKKTSQNNGLDVDKIEGILTEGKPDNKKFSTFKLYRNISNTYFKGKSNDEINDTIQKALESYFENKE